jgi:predicted nucleic acid-binding protein
MIRVYYDNVIASGLVTGKMWPDTEKAALSEIETAHEKRTIKRVTSRESWREQERTQDHTRRAQLQSARDLVSVVQADHRLLGFSNIDGPYGTVATNPIVTDVVDESLFKDLLSLGLKQSDARHFMYAAANSCDRFVTLDSDFLDRRQLLQARCPSLVFVTPSELAAELRKEQANIQMEPTRGDS